MDENAIAAMREQYRKMLTKLRKLEGKKTLLDGEIESLKVRVASVEQAIEEA